MMAQHHTRSTVFEIGNWMTQTLKMRVSEATNDGDFMEGFSHQDITAACVTQFSMYINIKYKGATLK